MSAIELTFLKQSDSKQAVKIATELAAFIHAAKSSLHIAIYDFRLTKPEIANPVINALKERADRGIEVKIAYYAGKPNPSGQGVMELSEEQFIEVGGDPAPAAIGDFLANPPKNIQTKGITGQKLMHNKYIVRDLHAADATVWTGSANFTDDAWTFQENNVLQIGSDQLCGYYETDFNELWTKGDIAKTGVGDRGTVKVGQATIDVAFSPGEGQTIDQMITDLIRSARDRIKVSSMVLTSHTILGALNDAIQQNQVKAFGGLYDATQMNQVVKIWKKSAQSADEVEIFQNVATHLVGKHSTPYSPTSKHDFMHNKVVVCDNAVVTGSFNFSRSAASNAENMLILHDKAIADQYAAYIDERTAHYKAIAKS